MWVPSLSREDPWRRARQPTPVFLPGESHGQRSLVGYSPWGHNWARVHAMQTDSLGLPVFLIAICAFFLNWLCCLACGILFPWPGIEPRAIAVKMLSPNHRTAREVPIWTWDERMLTWLLEIKPAPWDLLGAGRFPVLFPWLWVFMFFSSYLYFFEV